jgi:hypothetical protein
MEPILETVSVRPPIGSGGDIGAQHAMRRLQKVIALRFRTLGVITHRARVAMSRVNRNQHTQLHRYILSELGFDRSSLSGGCTAQVGAGRISHGYPHSWLAKELPTQVI